MRTANPALRDTVFEVGVASGASSDRMTLQGTVNRTGVLLALAMTTAAWSWLHVAQGGNPAPVIMGGLLVGLVLAIATIFRPVWAPYTAPAYALAEGAALGGISAGFEAMYPGIAFQAVFLTFGTLAGMLAAYSAGMVAATERFRRGVLAATLGIVAVYLVTFVLSFFGVSVPYLHGNGLIGIGFSLVVVGIAALNLVLDFDLIEKGVARGAPAYMQWYGAFALLVTLVWLYLEILRLLAKLNSRD